MDLVCVFKRDVINYTHDGLRFCLGVPFALPVGMRIQFKFTFNNRIDTYNPSKNLQLRNIYSLVFFGLWLLTFLRSKKKKGKRKLMFSKKERVSKRKLLKDCHQC